MPPSYIQAADATITTTTTQAKTTSTFNTQAGDVLVALAMGMISGNPPFPLTITDNKGPHTWVKQTEVQVNNATRYVAIWTTTTASAQTGMTVTFTKSDATTSTQWGGQVQTWRSAGSIGAANSAGSLTVGEVSLTTTGANSAVALIHADNVVLDVDTHNTSAGAWTSTLNLYSAFSYSINIGYYADVGTAGAKTVGLSGPTGQLASVAAVEIKVAGGAALSQHWGKVQI